MGGDKGPSVTLPSIISACRAYPDLRFLLFGPRRRITPFLYGLEPEIKARLTSIDTDSIVEMDEPPSQAMRYKQNSSMGMAIQAVQTGRAQACISAGNTGALLALSLRLLKPLDGVRRPALISSIPGNRKQRVFLLDLGANVSQDANILFQCAVMGAVMAQTVEGVPNPKVGLMNVGVEQNKGNAIVKDVNKLLLAHPEINYVGYIEGDGLFNSAIDVIVTDGYVGNIVLKASEGLAKFIYREAQKAANKNLITRIISWIALPVLKKIYAKVNPDQYNGASLIGLRGIVVKSHGNASQEAFFYAIKEAMNEVERQVPQKIEERINQVLANKAD